MTPRHFGSLDTGERVDAYTLANESGSSVQILTYGGIVTSLRVPDREARVADVVLGFDRLEHYLRRHPYFGAIVGRIAGRVTGGRLSVGGRVYGLARNDGANHLHGGLRGLDRRMWTAQPVRRPDGAPSLRLAYSSPDGEEGYPGNVDIAVTYTLTASNAFVVDTEATSDRPTPLSLAHHSYFNLAGEGSGSVLHHEVAILADEYVPAGADLTLSDRREPVDGRGADLREPRRLDAALPRISGSHGDMYLLGPRRSGEPAATTLAARVAEPATGRVLEVFTDESCLQFYTGSALDGTWIGKSGHPYGAHAGLCLECQGYPNASGSAPFDDILLQPGMPQRRHTVYAFSTS
jgi:aldose 1-epimerase